jgi:hypothetical protein
MSTVVMSPTKGGRQSLERAGTGDGELPATAVVMGRVSRVLA